MAGTNPAVVAVFARALTTFSQRDVVAAAPRRSAASSDGRASAVTSSIFRGRFGRMVLSASQPSDDDIVVTREAARALCEAASTRAR